MTTVCKTPAALDAYPQGTQPRLVLEFHLIKSGGVELLDDAALLRELRGLERKTWIIGS